jgi:rhodanese-related sulfurtransferase
MLRLLFFLLVVPAMVMADETVNIRDDLAYVDTIHNGKSVRIQRNQDTLNVVPFEYSFTSRPCPPFCIQPIKLAEGVETIGELELLEYLARIGKQDQSVLVIDSRDKRWLANGMIPGAVHIPWIKLHSSTTTPQVIARLLEDEFGAIPNGELWDFNAARTLVFYCNGPWCGQSPTSIRSLLTTGYPANRIKWYRGGMQSWLMFGLTVVK